MYYCNIQRLKQLCRFKTTLFILSAVILAFHSQSFAGVKDETVEKYRTKGYEEQQKGNYDQALTYYLKAVTLGEGNAVLYNDIGVAYEQLGLHQRAEEYYLKSIQVDPDYLPPYANVGFLYERRQDLKRAILFFRERYNRSDSGDPWKSKVAQELLRLDPTFRKEFLQDVLKEAREELLRKQQSDLQLSIMRAEQHYQRGMAFLRDEQYHEAYDEFESALKLTPDNPKIVKGREQALYGRRIEMIRRRFEQAIDEIKTGQVESAKSIFQDILTLIPNKPVVNSE